MILSAKRALLVIDSTKKVMEAIGTSLTAQTMMLHTQGWPQQDVSYFFLFILSCFLYLSLCTDCKQSPLFGEVRRTSQKISVNKRTQMDDSVARGDVQMRHAAAHQDQFFPRLPLCLLFLCFWLVRRTLPKRRDHSYPCPCKVSINPKGHDLPDYHQSIEISKWVDKPGLWK